MTVSPIIEAYAKEQEAARAEGRTLADARAQYTDKDLEILEKVRDELRRYPEED